MILKKLKKRMLLLGVGLLGGVFFLPYVKAQISQIPAEYFANYQIQKDWDRLVQLFIDIEANKKVGVLNSAATFDELYQLMKRLFPYFPQDYSSQVLYQQCYSTLENLERSIDRDSFSVFYENCYKPLQTLTTTISNKYTIKAHGTANPNNGSAPLVVTFDARNSQDPSQETIPQKNYFRYYRDIDGVDKPIGIGPVIKHTFGEAGSYMVHLVVRSSQKGIFDGEKTLSVNVSPKSANLAVYANSKKLDKNKAIKFGIQEARQGIIFDGSATIPMGGREILTHKWDIVGSDGFTFSRKNDGAPGYFNLPLPGQGQYKITLGVWDNEKNMVSETFLILISDPVAILKQMPEVGNTSTTFSFNSDASYSLTSRIRLVTREIFNQSGDKIDTFQSKGIQKKFTIPGNYVVKLTIEDELGQSNVDSINLLVESTPPIPQFTITPTNKWLYPSEFILDAQSSYDIDVANAGDEITFQRSFSSPNKTKIVETNEKNQKITVIFNEVGKHTISLQVSDKYGKIQTLSKDLEIKSILRPELIINPRASVRGNFLNYTITSNENLINYERNFGDSTQRVNQKNTMQYQYNKVGTYPVTVKVTDINGDSNQITSTVFIGEKDGPIPAYTIRNTLGMTLTQSDFCISTTKDGEQKIPVYRVKRQEKFIIDTADSVNAQGSKDHLSYAFQEKNKDIIHQQKLNHFFDTLGCQYIDYILEDTSIGTNVKERIWFKVVNDLPTLDNVVLSFPQYGNEMGIGFGQNEIRNIFDEGLDPIIVRAGAQRPRDNDGVVSYFKRYYYPKDNPSKILSTKITPGDIPYTFFSVPKQPGEFMFGVTMYDNDDGKQSSEEIIGNGPVVFFPPDTKQPDIPMVTLKSDKINVEVGEEVTFDVIAKILSDRSDFIKERTIQIDFDGDGEIDLVTKDDRIKHIYTKPSPERDPYRPIAYVSYRGYKGQGEGNAISVKNAIKPALIYSTLEKTAIIKDISIGNIIEREICFDMRECEKGNKKYLNTTLNNPLIITYPEYGTYPLSMRVKDSTGNEVTIKTTIVLDQKSSGISITTGVNFVSVPQAQPNLSGVPEIFVGKALNNEVVFFIDSRGGGGNCFIDKDIDVDSDGDGIPDNDKDFYCNKPYLQSYVPTVESVKGRIYYLPKSLDNTNNSKLIMQDFLVTFSDFDNGLDEEMNLVYEKINQLLITLDDQKWIANANLRIILVTLRNELGDKNMTRENVILINHYIKENPVKLTAGEEKLLASILVDLQDFVTLSALGENTYVIAKNEILSLLPSPLKEKIKQAFDDFDLLAEEEGDLLQKRKEILNVIFVGVQKKVKSGTMIENDEIFKEDFEETFLPNYCKIVDYFAIGDNVYCSNDSQDPGIKGDSSIKDKETNVQKPERSLPFFVKILLWGVGGVIVVFLVIVVVFAIKAKLKKSEDDES